MKSTRTDQTEEFAIYLNYVRKLTFDETPDYDFLRELFSTALKNGGEEDDQQYDWMMLNNGRGWEVNSVSADNTVTQFALDRSHPTLCSPLERCPRGLTPTYPYAGRKGLPSRSDRTSSKRNQPRFTTQTTEISSRFSTPERIQPSHHWRFSTLTSPQLS